MTLHKFKLKQEHLKLLRRANIYWDFAETGAPAIDPKRPYGNSNVIEDIAEILEEAPSLVKDGENIFSDEQEEKFLKLHQESLHALQVVLQNLTIKPGDFENVEEYGYEWERVK